MKSDTNLKVTQGNRSASIEVACLMSVVMIGLFVTLLEIYIAVSWDGTYIAHSLSTDVSGQEAAEPAAARHPIELAYVDVLGKQALFLSDRH